LDHPGRLWLGSQAVDLLKAFAHSQVIHRQQIGTIQHENQKHFRRPAADSFDGDQALDDFFIAHLGKSPRGYFPFGKMRGQVAKVAQLLPRETS